METRAASFADAADSASAGDVDRLSDADLLGELDAAFAGRRTVEARIVRLSGEIAERSRASLGADGLARRNGSSNASGMIASIGLIGTGDAARFCRVGEATAPRRSLTGEVLPPTFEALATAVNSGAVTVDSAAHIVTQLNQARPRSTVDNLVTAEAQLVGFAREASADDVRRLSIRWRDALDVDGIEPREEAMVAARSLKRIILPNGMKRFVIDLDPLSAAYLDTAIDAEVTANIRKVRFTGHDTGAHDPTGEVEASGTAGEDEALGDDPRTIAQMSADVLVDLARHALSCQNTLLSLVAATVVVRMTEEALVSGLGAAEIDGIEQPISAGTARRLAAEGEIIPLVLGGSSEILDLGRGQRLFSRAQRIAIAERDRGCAEPNCTRPPSHTEAHHIRWWKRDGGRTDLENGVLLCTRGHNLIHTQGWQIRVERGTVWFIPPPTIDPHQRPRRGGQAPTPRLD